MAFWATHSVSCEIRLTIPLNTQVLACKARMSWYVWVKAINLDEGQYSQIRYKFVPDADGSSEKFELNENTGIILTKRRIDREEKQKC